MTAEQEQQQDTQADEAEEMAEAQPDCDELQEALDTARASLAERSIGTTMQFQGNVAAEMSAESTVHEEATLREIDRLEQAFREAGCD